MDVAPAILAWRDDGQVLGLGVVRRRQVGRAEHELGHRLGHDLERDLARLAGRDRLRLGDEPTLELCDRRGEPGRRLALDAPLELGTAIGGKPLEPLPPGFVLAPAAPARPRPGVADRLRYIEDGAVPAERRLGAGKLLRPERLAMRLRGAGLFRRAVADRGLAGDERRPVRALRPADRPRDRRRIVPVDAQPAPARGLDALDLIGRVRERQRPVDRDAVVVEQHDELGEPEVPGERDRLLAQPLHEVAVGGEHIGVVVDGLGPELGREHALGERHPDRRAKALAERSGGGLDARRHEAFGMPRRLRVRAGGSGAAHRS